MEEIKIIKKILALMLALILVVAMCACNGGNGDDTTAETTTAAESGSNDAESTTADKTTTAEETTTEELGGGDGDDVEPDYVQENLFLGADVENPKGAEGATFGTNAQKILPGESVATKFTVTQGTLAGVLIGCPSWNDSKGTLTITIYSWVDGEGDNVKAQLQDGYAKTVVEKPIMSQTFKDFGDNQTLQLYLDAVELPEGGTYLVVVSNPDEEDFGVEYQKSNFDARTYYDALEYHLPDDLADYGYDPQYTTDVTAFNTNGVPSTSGYMNLVAEVAMPAGTIIE